MYDICLFDLDGTLTDSAPGIFNAFRYALGRLGAGVPDDAAMRRFLGPPLRDTFRALGVADVDEAVRLYREYFAEKGMFENAVYPGVPELLAKLNGRGVTCAVATSKYELYAERIVRHFGLDGHFAVIAGSEWDGRRARKSEVILYALARLGATPGSAVVMVGDRDYDMIGAKEAGVDSVGALWGYGSRAELAEAGAGRLAESAAALGILLGANN